MFIILPHYLAFISINALPILWYLLILISTFNPLTGPDTTRPVVTCPPDQTAVAAQGATSAVVTYNPMATTDDGSPINYSPLSGSSFNVGAPTTVYAFATDTASNTGFCMFTVTVSRKLLLLLLLLLLLYKMSLCCVSFRIRRDIFQHLYFIGSLRFTHHELARTCCQR